MQIVFIHIHVPCKFVILTLIFMEIEQVLYYAINGFPFLNFNPVISHKRTLQNEENIKWP